MVGERNKMSEKIQYCICCGSAVEYRVGRLFFKKTTCPICHAELSAKRGLSGKGWKIRGVLAEETAEIAEKVIEARERLAESKV